MSAKAESAPTVPATRLVRWRDTLWRLVVSTVGTCFRGRVTGLAAEAAFFALLSLPPLLFGLAGSIGYVFDSINPAQVEQVRRSILEVCSRALNVFVETITIMYGLGGHRGIVKTRILSFSLYVMGLITGVVTLPLVVAGPRLVDRLLPDRLDFLNPVSYTHLTLPTKA